MVTEEVIINPFFKVIIGVAVVTNAENKIILSAKKYFMQLK